MKTIEEESEERDLKRDGSGELSAALTELMPHLRSLDGRVRELVREHPLEALGTAVALGWVIGRLLPPASR